MSTTNDNQEMKDVEADCDDMEGEGEGLVSENGHPDSENITEDNTEIETEVKADVEGDEPVKEDEGDKDGEDNKSEDKKEKKKTSSDEKKSTRERPRRKRYFNPDRAHEIMANNVKKQRTEVWKKTVMLGPLLWEDTEDPIIRDILRTSCTCSLIRRKKNNDSHDCHLEVRFVNQGDAADVCDQFERPQKTRSGHTIRRRTRMPLESQLQEWDQTMFSRMYMGNRVFLYVDNIPPTAMKEDVFATFNSCSYITYSLKPDLLTGYAVLEYRGDDDIANDLSDEPKMLHGNVLNTFPITRTTQFHDRGRPVARRDMEMEEPIRRDRGNRRDYDRYDDRRRSGNDSRNYGGGGGGGGYNRGYNRGGGGGYDDQYINPNTLGDLESMLLQEIGRKVMMQGSQGYNDGGGGGRSSYNRYGDHRW